MRISYCSSDVCSSDLLTYLLKQEYRRNTYDEATGTVTVTDRRAPAMAETGAWYQRLYGADPELRQTRDNYAMKENTLHDPALRAALADFFSCTDWASAPDRPGYPTTSTTNRPPDPLIDNKPTPT